MGCILKLTAVVALAAGFHISLSSEALAHSGSRLSKAFSATIELSDQHPSNSGNEDGIPGDSERSGGGRLQNYQRQREGLPDADGDTGSR
ncbi:MAG: hypothetical protein WBA13_12320 [Microcoleaceae cyanobacterium]